MEKDILDEQIDNMERMADELIKEANTNELTDSQLKSVDNLLMMVPFCYDKATTDQQKSRLTNILMQLFPISTFKDDFSDVDVIDLDC